MSAGTSVPRPRLPGLDMTDSALLASLLREAPAGFAFIGPDSRVLRMNAAMAALSAGSEPGRACAEIWPADLVAAADAAVLAVGAGEPPVPQTEHVIADPGEPGGNGRQPAARNWSFSWFPSADGEIRGVAAIAVDTTAQHDAAEALRSSQETLRSSEEALRRSEERLAAVHSDDRDRIEAAWRECLRSGKVFDSRYRVRSRSGSYRHYDVRAVPIERDGAIVEWMGASTDVTAQREAEEMRGRVTEQLSAAALRTARLQQATSMLAEALTVEQVVEVITEVG